MSHENRSKLNHLLRIWPTKAICLSSWLGEHDISQPLTFTYVKSGWLEKIGSGAFKRAGETVDWMSGLQAIQEQAKLNIHLGGKSALQYQGYGHYLPLGEHQTLHLFGYRNIKLPAWFSNYAWKAQILYMQTNLFPPNLNVGLTTVNVDGIVVKSSTAERAIMEVIYLVPRRETYDQALQLMGSLSTLRPNIVQSLLEKCNSIKVKRAFMVMAEQYNYPWIKELDLASVDFGKGKRVFIKNGYLEPKYQITIPRNFDQDVEV
ncbi:MAG: type IV toxin-antitoxin system AbiEi family antitoxin domain-containing protein [Gammaproteobacteria bacterium]